MHVVISEIITFCVITLCVKKVISICVKRLLHFALKILLHFALVLHFAAILITFCVNITFCGDYYILRRKRHLHLDQRILYYNAMIKQIVMYSSSVWVSTSVDNLNKVFRLQKRAARVILNADTRANSVNLFRELNWLPFFMKVKLISAH